MARLLLARSRNLIRAHWLILLVLAVWAFAPLVGVLGRYGGDLIGTNGGDYFDQLQYLAWIRDEGSHGLASNLWGIGPASHDYLHPMYAISGLLWRLGASIQVAYLVWKPIAVLGLFLGFAAYVRHLLPESRRRQAAALFLALFYITPVVVIVDWTRGLSGIQFDLIRATDDADSALSLWGFEHTALAIALMPVFLMAVERRIAVAGRTQGRARGWTALAAGAGLLVAWLHPWQGATLLAILGGLVVFSPPRRRHLALIVPAVATLLPLLYAVVLSHADAAWRFISKLSALEPTAPWWALLASFAPLVVFAALGVRRPRSDGDWMLVLWPPATAAIYFGIHEFPSHALSGVMLPLSVLAVRGWQRLRLPQWVAAPVGVAAVLAVTVPTSLYHADQTRDTLSSSLAGLYNAQMLRLTRDQARALTYLDGAPRAGGVLAPWLLSMSVPAFTDRQVYAGHTSWQPRSAVLRAGQFFDPNVKDPDGAFRQALVRQSNAAFVLSDCGAPAALTADIAPVARPVKRFGCVVVYETGRG